MGPCDGAGGTGPGPTLVDTSHLLAGSRSKRSYLFWTVLISEPGILMKTKYCSHLSTGRVVGTGGGSGQPQEGGSAHSGPSPHTRLSRQRVSVLTCPLFWTASFFLNIYLFVCAESYLQPVGTLIFVASCDPLQSACLGNSMDRGGHKRVGHD